MVFVMKVLDAVWKVKYGWVLDRSLPEAQFLFRSHRGCEDLAMILSLTRDRLLDLKVPAMFLYNDYKNAFQDISQAGIGSWCGWRQPASARGASRGSKPTLCRQREGSCAVTCRSARAAYAGRRQVGR
jgi:hypothetical protein